MDANVRDLGIDIPTVAMVADYPVHLMTAGLSAAALFPGAQALAPVVAEGWKPVLHLATRNGSWNETGPVQGEVTRDPAQGEEAGPLTIALALNRPSPRGPGEQRVVVVGDGDFLSNAHLSHGGNLDLGLRLVALGQRAAGPGASIRAVGRRPRSGPRRPAAHSAGGPDPGDPARGLCPRRAPHPLASLAVLSQA